MNNNQDYLKLVRILSPSDLTVVPVLNITQSRICVCCGERIAAKDNSLSRDPNVCASCSSLSDGMDEQDSPRAGGNDDRQTGIDVPVHNKPNFRSRLS